MEGTGQGIKEKGNEEGEIVRQNENWGGGKKLDIKRNQRRFSKAAK